MEFYKKKCSPNDNVFTILYVAESKVMLSCVDVCWRWDLTSCSIYPWKKDCMCHDIWTGNCEGCSTVKLIVIGHLCKLEEACLLVLVGRIHPPSIGSFIKSTPKWVSLLHAKSTNSTMMFSA